MHRTNRLMDC